MAREFPCLQDNHREFIGRQHVFFTASAAAGSHVNLSPRSTETFRVLGPDRIAYLDLTGSGNETSAHLRAGGRATVMFCAFDGPPLILRLYGRGRAVVRGTADYLALLAAHFGREPVGARQFIELELDLVKTSCGYGVPLFGFEGERPSLANWLDTKGEEGLAAYRRAHNLVSMDGLPASPLEG